MSGTDPDTVDLVTAVRAGDLHAFGRLYEHEVAAVQTVVRSQVHDRRQAEDVVQDVFVRALESLSKLQDASRFHAWLLGIARHTAVDARRRNARQPIAMEHAEDTEPSTELEPPRVAELAELSDLVWTAVAGLSQRDATAMAMVSLGFGIADVAVALGITHPSAKVAVHRARERARAVLMVEVVVRRQGPHCPAVDLDVDVVLVAQHLRGCAECQIAVRQSL